ncbi:MAG: methyltransferase [Bacteroidetes bacterium GWE2_41_25]|nr:MAG: methyltransferase [Bacteroidetes bacterium GWA2_40_15]OFX91615.1 MAG: methyltransferase [Bacteroidetes bacterium GWE2_41_25]HBQ81270.1 methyltransferase [Bacteroidales bacterium]HCU18969.1 methyltransferase [Bacteroidales bacterium]
MNRKLEQYIKEHSSKEDPVLEDLYRQTYIRFVNPNMATGHLQGKFLELIAKMINPESILEIGTFTGYSTICLARGLRNGGRLVTIELNDELRGFVQSYFIKAGVDRDIVQMTGNAIEVLPSLDMMFDLVFIDGDKREYCDYYRLIKNKVRKGGYILADNVLWGEKVLETATTDKHSRGIIEFNNMIMNEKDIEHVIIPLRDGLTIIRKL